MNHSYKNTANEEFDECASCGLVRARIEQIEADGISTNFFYRKFNTIEILDKEPECE